METSISPQLPDGECTVTIHHPVCLLTQLQVRLAPLHPHHEPK